MINNFYRVTTQLRNKMSVYLTQKNLTLYKFIHSQVITFTSTLKGNVRCFLLCIFKVKAYFEVIKALNLSHSASIFK